MYNLDYTYLTDLEVDTRQTFADLSDDLLLINDTTTSNKIDKTFNMKTLISCWQDFFWKSNDGATETLDVIFTDLSIERSGLDRDENEVMTYRELTDFLQSLNGSWAGNRSFSQLCAALIGALDKMSNQLDTSANVYPIGSIVVSDTNPNTSAWTQRESRYLSENMKNGYPTSELSSMGIHGGKNTNGTMIGTNLGNATLTPKLSSGSAVPDHTHILKFNPETGSGGSTTSGVVAEDLCTFGELKVGSSSSPYTGLARHKNGTIVSSRATGLCVDTGVNKIQDDHNGKGNEPQRPNFRSSESQVIDGQTIKVAPKTYPLSAYVYERVV